MYLLASIDNARIREILPLLRPRSAEPTLFSQTVFYLFLAGLATLVILYFVRRYHLIRRRRREFREYGMELGLDDSQIALLSKVGHREKMKNPLRLLTSGTMFDRHAGAFAGRLAERNLEHELLDAIFGIREVLGFDSVPEAKALNSTRQIEKGQSLLVWQESDVVEGFSPWLVVDRNEGALSLVPILEGDKGYFTDLKVGDAISARFWREGDTEYRLDTHVVQVDSSGTYLLQHADVERLQQRDFFRIDVDLDVSFFAIPVIDAGEKDAEEEGETGEGLRAVEEDAAIALLDQEEKHGPRAPEDGELPTGVTDIPLDSDEDEAPSQTGFDLANAPRFDASVINISAGGMGVIVHGELPGCERWLVDPAFEGSFPLASVVCRVLGTPQGSNASVKLKFEDLAPQAEGNIVRMVYQHQLLGADRLHGYDTTSRPGDMQAASTD